MMVQYFALDFVPTFTSYSELCVGLQLNTPTTTVISTGTRLVGSGCCELDASKWGTFFASCFNGCALDIFEAHTTITTGQGNLHVIV
jgi:hypothetical protein